MLLIKFYIRYVISLSSALEKTHNLPADHNVGDIVSVPVIEIQYLRWLVPVFHARAHVRLPTREDPPARKAKQIWRRSALFAKGYLAHFQKKFVFTRDCITKKVLSYFEIWKKSASGAQCSCFRYKWALVL